jgi:hypothetical protein
LAQFFVVAWRVLLLQGVLPFVRARPFGYARGVPHLIYQHVRGYLVLQQPALHLSCRRLGGLQPLPPVFHGLLWQTTTCRCAQLADAKSGWALAVYGDPSWQPGPVALAWHLRRHDHH